MAFLIQKSDETDFLLNNSNLVEIQGGWQNLWSYRFSPYFVYLFILTHYWIIHMYLFLECEFSETSFFKPCFTKLVNILRHSMEYTMASYTKRIEKIIANDSVSFILTITGLSGSMKSGWIEAQLFRSVGLLIVTLCWLWPLKDI